MQIRGALNAVTLLGNTHDTVVTHSSGNHAQALALAAKIKGLKAHIVMPNITTRIKKEAVHGYGADITECEPADKSRQEAAARVVQRLNGVFVSPANDFDIMAGQGTLALEMLEQVGTKCCITIKKYLWTKKAMACPFVFVLLYHVSMSTFATREFVSLLLC